MNILFVTRLYSGFEPSLDKLVWNPEGVPTIYNLINKVSRLHNLSIIFTAKDSGSTYTSNWTKRYDTTVKLKNLNANITVLTGILYFPKFLPRKLLMILRDIRQLIRIIFHIRKKNPELIYCDSANVVIAYILTKIFPKKPIVVRVLGVCSFWRSILSSKRLVHKIYKLSFKGSFSCVIGTQDGSGIEYWFKEVLKSHVTRYVLLNGVEIKKHIKTKTNRIKHILFVGRLEEYKGIIVFIKAIIKVLKNTKYDIKIIIVGDGTLFNKARNICKNSGFLKHFQFIKSIPHKEVLHYHKISDIYVSANTDGNLINTNLEAIGSNTCMIIPEAQRNKFIDIETSSLLKDSVLYYKVNDANDLKNKIMYLLKSPDKIIKLRKRIFKIRDSFIKTWKQRVDEEIIILENLINK